MMTPMTQVSGTDVDQIVVESGPAVEWVRTVGRVRGPASVRVLVEWLEYLPWYHVYRAARGAVARTGTGFNGTGFRYPSDRGLREEEFEGVNVYDHLSDIVVPLGAFEAVMSRYFQALIAGAERRDDPVRREAFWPELVRLAGELEARVRAG